MSDLRSLPAGLRWANGGGSNWGDCNGRHIAPVELLGTLCGRIAPNTIATDPTRPADTVCRSCLRVLAARQKRGEYTS